MLKTILENTAKIKAGTGKITKKMEVFYNPVMKLNRDFSILLLNALNRKKMQIALPLAGSGVRGIRFLKELKKGIIRNISFNDANMNTVKAIQNNLKLNKIKNKNITITNKDANLFLLENPGFDYIDIDPFGPPIKFLCSAVQRLSRNGILAVTATDTGALCGTFPAACRRKYWAEPKRCSIMHELGLRILIRKIQLIGTQYDKALLPIFSYSKEHYFRIFFICEKGKQRCDEIIKKHKMFQEAGPLWTGQFADIKLINKMIKLCKDEKTKNFLKLIRNENKINTIGFFDIHELSKKYKIKQIPNMESIFKRLKKASKTHFSPIGIKTEINEKEFVGLL